MPLQKSMSDQRNFKPKQHQAWQRSKSYPVAQQPPPRPPLPVSKSSKNKLQAFQFQPPQAGDTMAVMPAPQDQGGSLDREKQAPAVSRRSPVTSNKLTSTAITPLAKLEWKDLMGIPDPKNEVNEASPSERLMWQTRDMNLVPARSPILPRRGRKRARSSSPISSSPAISKPTTPAVNVKGLTEALRTPHADPALELWDKFTMAGASRTSPSGLTNPLLEQLMVPSSPHPQVERPSSSGKKERSLIRAISYDSTWSKRRKLRHANSDSASAFQGSPRASSKNSMVSALLETVDVEINRSEAIETEQMDYSSPSSPSTRSPSRNPRRSHHPSPAKKIPDVADDGSDGTSDTMDVVENKGSGGMETSSDYRDVDFDDDTLLELDAGVQAAQEDDTTLVQAPDSPPGGDPGNPSEEANKVVSNEDDFGDIDDDLFDGAEDMILQAESRHPSQALAQERQPAKMPLVQKDQVEEDDEYGDDFGGDFDFDAVEQAATEATQSAFRASSSLSHPGQKAKTIQRYLITNIFESTYEDERGCEFPEKILVVQAERTNSIKTVHLREDWYDTQASFKSYVHIIGDFDHSGMCVIDNEHNLIILHPDQLISSTVVADSFSCMRRAVLQDRVKATSESSKPLVYGTMLHEIFQAALLANQWSMDFLGSVIDKTLEMHLEDLYVIQISLNKAKNDLLSKMTELRSWAAAFVSNIPRSDAIVQGRKNERISMCVSKLLDVEEHVWSPMYGLKGNIDATVQVTIKEGSNVKTLTVPFEVKTGKRASPNHRAQTVLYNLLLTDRYDIDIMYGILYYMETSETHRIPALRHELRPMIMKRNELAGYIRERSVQLPPMLKQKHACNRCYAQSTCFTYHKLADDGDGETSAMGAKFGEVVKHLTPRHKEFFLKWEDLLTKEEKQSQKLRRELWTMLSTEREKVGRCFSSVIIEEGSASEDTHNSRINRFSYTFVKETFAPGFSFLESQLTVGEPIVISDEQGHFALALGYVTKVSKRRISVAVDRRLHNARIRQPGFDEIDNQVFASIMEVAPEGVPPDQSQGKTRQRPIRYRLDKDEFSNGMAAVRNNLVQIMADGTPGSREIRELVVDLRPPRFNTPSQQSQYVITGKNELNIDQKHAIEKVMSAMDYALILGMPGTGKTTTIAHIIRALVSQGKSVLLTSYTHTAVDNILLKLKKDNMPILRIGATAKVHPEVKEFATLAGQPMSSFEEIHRAWHDTPIVATTCLGINHPIFAARRFDYCIVDEASQITLPICIGPIRAAKTFVLVGDHNQLPPLVQNEEARVGGLDISLFKLLSDAHPQSVASLEHQYRMCEDIMALSNTLIYKGRLKCGFEELRFRSLDVPNMEALRQRHFDAATLLSLSQRERQQRSSPTKARLPNSCSPRKASGVPSSFCLGPRQGSCWLRDLLDPSARARFVNTDGIPGSREEARGNRIVNHCEVQVVTQVVDALLTAGVAARDIGIMTHYRSQLALLKHALAQHHHHGPATADVEMHTADRFQGRDKEVVVLSLVRSNEACSIGELLRDWRRINVAFTRAKTKLLVIGSRATLQGRGAKGKAAPAAAAAKPGAGEIEGEDGGEMLARFVDLMEARDWIYDLPADALEAHYFPDDGPTQTTTASGLPAKAVTSPKTGRRKPMLSVSPSKRSSQQGAGGASQRAWAKENAGGGAGARRPEPRKARIGERVLLKGKPILRDILNEMTDGAY